MICPYCKKEIGTKKRILDLLEKREMIISDISKELKIVRPAIYEHLKKLEKQGLIKRQKDPKKKGAPVTISRIKKWK